MTMLFMRPDGTVQAVHDESFPLPRVGEVTSIRRASHVEPAVTPHGLQWTADMSPADGPILGPFSTRTQALKEEIAWLNHRLSLGPLD